MAWFESQEDKQRRQRIEDEAERRRREEQLQRERRLENKRERLLPLIAEARAEDRFLDLQYREQYAYNQQQDVLTRISKQIPGYEQWLMDEDFLQGRLCTEDDLATARTVWAAKKDLVDFAGRLTPAQITSRRVTEFEEMKKATALGLTVDQYRHREARIHAVLQDLREQFDSSLRLAINGDDVTREMVAQHLGFQSNDEMLRYSAETAEKRLELPDEQRGFFEGLEQSGKISGLIERFYSARVAGEATDNAELREDVELHLASKGGLLGRDDELADYVAKLEEIAHRKSYGTVDLIVKSFESRLPPKTGQLLQLTVPWQEWGEEYKRRIGSPRTAAEFMVRIQRGRDAAQDTKQDGKNG